MERESHKDDEEQLQFWRGWTGLYVLTIAYGVLQIILLYIFTNAFNRP